jgi:hypothetical protein
VFYGEHLYSPNLQRWPNRDPIEERGGLNLYAYVRNNPINLFDPLGFVDCATLASLIAHQENNIRGAIRSMSDINQMSQSAYYWEYGAAGGYALELIPASLSLAENAAATAATRFSSGGVDYVVSATGLVRARGTSTFYYTLRKAAQARANGAIDVGTEQLSTIAGKEVASQTAESWSPMFNANPLQGLANAENEMAGSMPANTYATIQLLQRQLANMMDMYRQNCPCKK